MLQIYNTATQKKEKFEPLVAREVKMYVCGPTVYDYLHIGNFRGAIFFNLVRNWLEKQNYKVTYVYNYTDVDDKIINKANEEKKTSQEISEFFIKEFEKDFSKLGLRKHDYNPRVTEFIKPIIATIQKIIDSGCAYVVDGEVIFSVKKFKDYGKLSHKNLDDLMSGIRVEVSQKKDNPLDFTLWKPAKPGEPKWDSPWGAGRPGWHIECSAMVTSILGEQIDIHGGGVDLIFPHHENEIAQSEAATHKTFAKYWMHNNFLNFGAHKMSKSLGNVKTAKSFMEQYGPEVLKYLYLRAHYRSLVDFSEHQIQDAIQGLARIYSAMALASEIAGPSELPSYPYSSFDTNIQESLNDDFNTPKMFAQIFEVIRMFNSKYKRGQKISPDLQALARSFLNWIQKWGQLLTLFQELPSQFLMQMDDLLLQQKQIKRSDVDLIVQNRNQARAQKDFKASDQLRDQLLAMGIQISDTPHGTFWEVQK